MMKPAVTARPLLLLFFLSGISGLIYQLVWFRRLALIFGVTSYALGIVLAAFMAGLALGSAAGGWWAERTTRPLRAYALTELGIALLGTGVSPLIGLVQHSYVSLAPHYLHQTGALTLLRFALSFAVLIPATLLMGATLPLGVRALDATSSRGVSGLYAANTSGAVVGVLTGGFLLLGVFGLRVSTLIAAGLNVCCGLMALFLARTAHAVQPLPAGLHDESAMSGIQRTVLLVTALSGFVGLASEIVWTRLFSVLAYEVVYGYSIMLAVLLAGIAFGSSLYGRFASRSDSAAAVNHLVWLQFGIGCSAAVSLVWLHPLAAGNWLGPGGRLPGMADLIRRCSGCVSLLPGLFVVVFVSSALSGAAIPAAARICAGSGRGWAKRLGATYASNVMGGMLGSVAVGFWALPAFGAHVTILLLAAVNIIVASALALTIRRRTLSVSLAAVGLVCLLPATIGRAHFDIFRTTLSARVDRAAILWFDEGVESSVAVAKTPSGDKLLLINGAVHSSTNALEYHRWLGHLGVMAHPHPREALVIGLGGGGTAGSMALYQNVNVHVVELSRGVLAAADVLKDDNYSLFSRPRVTCEVDDGRNHLLVSGRRYDVIEADIVEPRHAGAGVLYSHEFFENARQALKPGGIMVQWLGSPGTDAYMWTLNTFRQTFPYVTLWIGAGDVGIGSNDPQTPLDPARLEAFLANPLLKSALDDVHLGSVERIMALRALHPRRVPQGPVLTDDRPLLEYFLTLPPVTRMTYGTPFKAD